MNGFLIPLLLLLLLWPQTGAEKAQDSLSRRLVICADGVSFEDFEALRAEGRFAYLQPPGRLISAFPSLTNAAMVEIVPGSPVSPGFEDRYFDVVENRMRGGLGFRLSSDFVSSSFRREFEFHPPGLLSAFEYVVAPFTCQGIGAIDLSRAISAFRSSDARLFRVYIGPTDCAAHTGGRWAIRSILRKLDDQLKKLIEKESTVEISLFSDHGNVYLKHRSVNLIKPLKQGGFRVRNSLDEPRDVVFPRFGLVGAAILYSGPEVGLEVAELVSKVPGVDFATVYNEPTAIIFQRGLRAEIRSSDGRLTYDPIQADPLGLSAQLTRSPQEWLNATTAGLYPDGVNRIWLQSRDAVQNQATVVVSFEDGYYVGSKILDLFVALKATHGALTRDQSLGFIATSDRKIPEYVPGRDAWEALTGPDLP